MRRIAILALVAAGPAGAADWTLLEGREIRAALSARVLGFADGSLQDFFADGRTLRGATFGRWKVEGDAFCLQWPPSGPWTCERVARAAGGLDLKFVAPDGSERVGRYVDLH